MTDMSFTDVGEDWTYEKRRGWLNTEQAPAIEGDGKIHKFMTKLNLPAMIPDQWKGSYETERIPDDVTAIGIAGGQVIKLWVDDIRRPPDDTWAWARTNDKARAALEQFDVRECSLDHDMGHHDRDPDDEESLYLRGDSEDDGTKLAEWMLENGKVPQAITIHSWNYPAAERMANMLRPQCLKLQVQPYEVPVKA